MFSAEHQIFVKPNLEIEFPWQSIVTPIPMWTSMFILFPTMKTLTINDSGEV